MLTGSTLCTLCVTPYTLVLSTKTCALCGDGFVQAGEICDDGNFGGCLPNCSNSNTNFTCTGGSVSTASACTCLPGFILTNHLCLPICGDGKVVGNEMCDDGLAGGCMNDCSGPNLNYTCSGGSPTTASLCIC